MAAAMQLDRTYARNELNSNNLLLFPRSTQNRGRQSHNVTRPPSCRYSQLCTSRRGACRGPGSHISVGPFAAAGSSVPPPLPRCIGNTVATPPSRTENPMHYPCCSAAGGRTQRLFAAAPAAPAPHGAPGAQRRCLRGSEQRRLSSMPRRSTLWSAQERCRAFQCQSQIQHRLAAPRPTPRGGPQPHQQGARQWQRRAAPEAASEGWTSRFPFRAVCAHTHSPEP